MFNPEAWGQSNCTAVESEKRRVSSISATVSQCTYSMQRWCIYKRKVGKGSCLSQPSNVPGEDACVQLAEMQRTLPSNPLQFCSQCSLSGWKFPGSVSLPLSATRWTVLKMLSKYSLNDIFSSSENIWRCENLDFFNYYFFLTWKSQLDVLDCAWIDQQITAFGRGGGGSWALEMDLTARVCVYHCNE